MRAEQADTQVEHDRQGAALPHGLDQAELLAGGAGPATVRRVPATAVRPGRCVALAPVLALALVGCGGGGGRHHAARTATAAAPAVPPPLRARAACDGAPDFTCATLRVPLDRVAARRSSAWPCAWRSRTSRRAAACSSCSPAAPASPASPSRRGSGSGWARPPAAGASCCSTSAARAPAPCGCPALQRAMGTLGPHRPPRGRREGLCAPPRHPAHALQDRRHRRRRRRPAPRAACRRGCRCWARPTARSSPSATRWPTHARPGAWSSTPSCPIPASRRRAPAAARRRPRAARRLPGAPLPGRPGCRPRRRRPARPPRRRALRRPHRPVGPGARLPRGAGGAPRGPGGRPRRPCGRSSRPSARAQRAPATVLSQGLHAATLCAESRFPWPVDLSVARRRAPLARPRAALAPGPATAPFDAPTATGNGFVAQCRPWPPVRRPAPVARDLPRVPVLLLAGDRDLSTPLAWAREEAARAPRGRLVVARGRGHGVLRQVGRGRCTGPSCASCRRASRAGTQPAPRGHGGLRRPGRAGGDCPRHCAPGATSAVTTARTPTRATGPTVTPRSTTARGVDARAAADPHGCGDEALPADRDAPASATTWSKSSSTTSSPSSRLRPDVDALVGRDDAAGPQPRARPDDDDGAGATWNRHRVPIEHPSPSTTEPPGRRPRRCRARGATPALGDHAAARAQAQEERTPGGHAATVPAAARVRPAAARPPPGAPAQVLAQQPRRAQPPPRPAPGPSGRRSASASGEPGTGIPAARSDHAARSAITTCPSAGGVHRVGQDERARREVVELDDARRPPRRPGPARARRPRAAWGRSSAGRGRPAACTAAGGRTRRRAPATAIPQVARVGLGVPVERPHVVDAGVQHPEAAARPQARHLLGDDVGHARPVGGQPVEGDVERLGQPLRPRLRRARRASARRARA